MMDGMHVVASRAAEPGPDMGIEFFENRIRPVLVERCYECHNHSGTAEADLALDSRDAMRKATGRGVPVVPGEPEKSLLLQVVRHQIDGLEMPQGGPQLEERVIEDLREWIFMGAPDPRDKPPSASELAKATAWETVLEQRKQWWSFQPIRDPDIPTFDSDWSSHPIDQFVLSQLKSKGLQPAQRADRRTLIRRLSFVLTGLPPTVEEIHRFLNDDRPDAFSIQVDHRLDSKRFGERWARHWMDWVRYADSHGSEGDPSIPHAYQYRDYLIRALNADVPYDQLVREHVSGDLLPNPRINRHLGINESAIGPAHWRLVFHGFAPTDALDEKVRFTDDQINVFSKAFLGLTVSCARCHDHKFDAISQKDYYALFGILGSCRPALRDVNTPDRQQLHQPQLQELKREIRRRVADAWLEIGNSAVDAFARAIDPSIEQPDGKDKAESVLRESLEIQSQMKADSASFATVWSRRYAAWTKALDPPGDEQIRNAWQWKMSESKACDDWYEFGNGLTGAPSPAGEFTVASAGDGIIEGIFPAGVYTHGFSTKHRGFLGSPRIYLDDRYQAWLRIAGSGKATVRFVVHNYPRSGTVYPIPEINNTKWYWQKLDLTYWQGDQVHFELATARDAPLQINDVDRSWFAVREVVVRKLDQPPPDSRASEFLEPLIVAARSGPPNSMEDLAICFGKALRDSAQAWQSGRMTDGQALFLSACLRDGLLPNQLDQLADVKPLVARYRQLEDEIPLPTRVPGLVEADAFDQPLYERGNHRKPLAAVPRRFLEAIDSTPYKTFESGRLELAEDLLRADNPLTARVIVNRIWHYLFGQGLVRTTDNFGRLGETPSHPELLDYLATRFIENGWSIKDMIRFIVSAETWRMDSRASRRASQIDPNNRLVSHADVRRLDAEAIRDSLLQVAGQIDFQMYGPSVAANGDSTRRSVYTNVRRNSLDQFLQVFDAPVPFSTTGRRNVTNVPAQSLTLLNDPFVTRIAQQWASDMLDVNGRQSAEDRVATMFERALGREPTVAERRSLLRFVDAIELKAESDSQGKTDEDQEAWSRLAHALFNLKEFIYIR